MATAVSDDDRARGVRLLQETVDCLLASGGCAWSRNQTSNNLIGWLRSECDEVAEAVELLTAAKPSEKQPALDHLSAELGDVLFDALMLVLVSRPWLWLNGRR